MRNKLVYSFEADLTSRFKNPKFKKLWDESELEYQIAKQMIEKRLKKKISQRDLAKKLKTSQAVISRIETMRANPSIQLLKRIAVVLDSKINLQFK
jgi:ribosome-binding protein aMBF1 (putative translation factor)